MQQPIIKDNFETLVEHKSLIRFGDGEYELISGLFW